MKLIVSSEGQILDYASNIEYGYYEGEPVEKYKLSDADGKILHYLIADNVEMVEVPDNEVPDDFTSSSAYKYYFDMDISKISIRADFVNPENPLDELNKLAAVTFVLLAQKTDYVPSDVIREFASVFEDWSGEDSYSVGDIRRYEGELYRCITAVGPNPTWNPSAAPSVWTRFDDPAIEWPDWRQPTDATNVYASGSKVTYEGQHWTSNVDNNSWAPGVYGWTLVP